MNVIKVPTISIVKQY